MSANIEGVARAIIEGVINNYPENKMADDDEIQAIRAKRLAELQAQYGGGKVELPHVKFLV